MAEKKESELKKEEQLKKRKKILFTVVAAVLISIVAFNFLKPSKEELLLKEFNELTKNDEKEMPINEFIEKDMYGICRSWYISIDKVFNISDFERNMIKFNQGNYEICLKFKDNYTKIELIIYSDEGLYQYEFLKEGI